MNYKLPCLTSTSYSIPRLIPRTSQWRCIIIGQSPRWQCKLHVTSITWNNPIRGLGGDYYYGIFHIPLYPISHSPRKLTSFLLLKFIIYLTKYHTINQFINSTQEPNIPPTLYPIPLNSRNEGTQESLYSRSKWSTFSMNRKGSLPYPPSLKSESQMSMPHAHSDSWLRCAHWIGWIQVFLCSSKPHFYHRMNFLAHPRVPQTFSTWF